MYVMVSKDLYGTVTEAYDKYYDAHRRAIRYCMAGGLSYVVIVHIDLGRLTMAVLQYRKQFDGSVMLRALSADTDVRSIGA